MHRAQSHELEPHEFAFEAMNMQVGVRLQFITHRRIKPVSYFSTLVGYVKDEYIIVRIPTENGTPIMLAEGERVTIRAFSGVNVCSFTCSVEHVFDRPLSYVHLSFPTTIQGTSLRSAMRVKTEMPARASSTVRQDAAPLDCVLTNISVTGARVDTRLALPRDEELIGLQFTLAIPGSGEETVVDTLAVIRNRTVEKSAADGSEIHSYGVQFTGLDPVHYTLLQNLTYETLLADRLNIV
jgi:c-di-GMP-binding flagellar brake protein YcgR